VKEEELAMALLEASNASLEQRFLDSLSQEMRVYCRKTVQMRTDFLRNVQRMMVSANQAEVLLYADKVESNAVEVAYRWGTYRYMLQQYAEREVLPVRVKVPNE